MYLLLIWVKTQALDASYKSKGIIQYFIYPEQKYKQQIIQRRIYN